MASNGPKVAPSITPRDGMDGLGDGGLVDDGFEGAEGLARRPEFVGSTSCPDDVGFIKEFSDIEELSKVEFRFGDDQRGSDDVARPPNDDPIGGIPVVGVVGVVGIVGFEDGLFVIVTVFAVAGEPLSSNLYTQLQIFYSVNSANKMQIGKDTHEYTMRSRMIKDSLLPAPTLPLLMANLWWPGKRAELE